MSVLLYTLDTKLSIQQWKKLGYALPIRMDYEETPNLKTHHVKDCRSNANKDLIFKRINELKCFNNIFSINSKKDDGLSTFPELERLRGKIGVGDFVSLSAVLHRNVDDFFFQKLR